MTSALCVQATCDSIVQYVESLGDTGMWEMFSEYKRLHGKTVDISKLASSYS